LVAISLNDSVLHEKETLCCNLVLPDGFESGKIGGESVGFSLAKPAKSVSRFCLRAYQRELHRDLRGEQVPLDDLLEG
jgi:hypothetical protein